jgi:cysteinyl-tRNA synthetase
VLRLLLISQHYRSPIDFSKDSLKTTTQALLRFYDVFYRVLISPMRAPEDRLAPIATKFFEDFDQAMCDDFNTPRAIALLHDLTTAVNRTLDDNPQVTRNDIAEVKTALFKVGGILGILDEDPGWFLKMMKQSGISNAGVEAEEIEDLIGQRTEARAARDFKRADEIRDTLLAKGIQLKDTPGGTTWEKM